MTVGFAATTLLITAHRGLMHCDEDLDEGGRALRHCVELVERLKVKNVKASSS